MSSEMKRKTAMVLHQIEEALGHLIITEGDKQSFAEKYLDSAHRRESDKGKTFRSDSIKDVVESAYLSDLFNMAIDITRDTSAEGSVKYLYSLFHQLDIYEIRNSISHPNRPFWDCYWYRVATIASDPAIELLKLRKVKEALASAEAGIISDPPDGWLKQIIWQIPNNLPAKFEHGVTGLIGRNNELKELHNFVKNPRVSVIALVAPGGIGKTAIALDLLNAITDTPTYANLIDAVIYISLKTEKLTDQGVVSLDAAQTIAELKHALVIEINQVFDESYETLDRAIECTSEHRVLLCIDNLETLLRDNPESFDHLNMALPPCWKVLVTSRVTITSAAILSLDELRSKAAVHLARRYMARRGGPDLANEQYESLTEGCYKNPLAIRLILDAVTSGHAVPESITSTNQQIAEFSYNNLIDILSRESVEVLEAVFVEDRLTRVELCELLEKDLDKVSSCIGDLSRTSLINRQSVDQVEAYNLSNSVRELLLVSPRNIDVRETVQQKIRERRRRSQDIDVKQAQKDMPAWHWDYVPPGTGNNLKILITDINKGLHKSRHKREDAVSLYKKMKESEFIYSKEYLFQQAYARVLESLGDVQGAEARYKIAIDLDSNPCSARYLLGRLYHESQRFEDARREYEVLVRDGWTIATPDRVQFGRSIYKGYFLALLYLGHYDQVLTETREWKDAGPHRGTLGTFRASAWKRSMENLVESDPGQAVKALQSATSILQDVFREDGYFSTASAQAAKIFDEITYVFANERYCDQFSNEGLKLLTFVEDNIIDVEQTLSHFDAGALIDRIAKIALDGNPFMEPRWQSFSASGALPFIGEAEDNSSGVIPVRVKNRPRDRMTFLFAADEFDQDYFLHYDQCKDASWEAWRKLAVSDIVHILPSNSNDQDGRAISAQEVYLATFS